MSTEEKYYYLAFSAFEEGIGPMRFKQLLEYFKTAKNAWNGKQKEFWQAGIPQAITQKFFHFRSNFDIDAYLKELEKKEIIFLTLQDNKYPYLLKQISDAPFVLYVKGFVATLSLRGAPLSGATKQSHSGEGEIATLSGFRRIARNDNFESLEWWLTDNKIAVVGSRKPSSYGREVTEIITRELANSGLTIVSGMARGIDTIAHKTAMENGGKTIAVLGCGVDYIYPSDNKDLYEKICDGNGCIVSEMPLGHWATKGAFPARNRLISGLSKGVLMTEGTSHSGALITCSSAAEQGRDVYAVPGLVTSDLSAGTLGLLKKGARLVTCGQDICDDLGISYNSYNRYNNYSNYKDANPEEKAILDLLQSESLTIDDMIRKSGFLPSKVSGLLSLLEIKGYIKSYQGEYKINF